MQEQEGIADAEDRRWKYFLTRTLSVRPRSKSKKKRSDVTRTGSRVSAIVRPRWQLAAACPFFTKRRRKRDGQLILQTLRQKNAKYLLSTCLAGKRFGLRHTARAFANKSQHTRFHKCWQETWVRFHDRHEKAAGRSCVTVFFFYASLLSRLKLERKKNSGHKNA